MKNQRRKFATIAIAAASSAAILAGTAESATAASSDCPSGYMCVWSSSAYSGTLKKFSASSTYLSIGLASVGSYYNHRSKRSYLHESVTGSARSKCVNPGVKSASASGWQTGAKAVYLSTTTNC